MLKNKKLLFICSVVLVFTFTLAVPKSAFTVTPPTSTLSIDASATIGNNNWYTNAIPITITAIPGTNPVQSITYYVDSQTPTTIAGNSVTFTLIQQGVHTLKYYATDTQNISEGQKTLDYKIDLVAPANWSNFTVVNQGNSHTFTISVAVRDKTSGLDKDTAEFQYSVDDGATWGHYSSLTNCGSTWNNNMWRSASMSPNTSGSINATINIPTTDYCNSNWASTKYIRIRIKDMAGSLSTKQYALMAPWMRTTIGDVYSNGIIDMTTEGSTSSDGIIQTSTNTINNFSSSIEASAKDYTITIPTSYSHYYSKLSKYTTPLPGTIPSTSGIYTTADLNLTSSKLPSSVATTPNLALIIFVSGNLFIDTPVTLMPTSGIIWISTGDIGIRSSVNRADGVYISDGDFSTSYDGSSTSQLTINGSVISSGTIDLPRSLNGTSNLNTPSEIINHNPGLVLNNNLLNLFRITPNLTWKEVIEY
ncbi:MAG: hypothetical protein M3P33_01370 [bacterium]|nr:hypothetical protein [bacterium]